MPSAQVVDAWGSRLNGEVVFVSSNAIVIAHPAIAGEVSLPIATLATLTSLRPLQKPSELPGRIGRLDYDSGTMLGCPAPAPPAPSGAAIAWQPVGSLIASPVTFPENDQPKATITHAEKPAESRPQPPQRGRKPQLLQQASQAQDRLLPPEAVQVNQTAPDWFGSRLILRTGETLFCRVESIDEQSVRVRVPGGEPATVAADQVQAVELGARGDTAVDGRKNPQSDDASPFAAAAAADAYAAVGAGGLPSRPARVDGYPDHSHRRRGQSQGQAAVHSEKRCFQADLAPSGESGNAVEAAAAQERRWIAGGEGERQHPAAADDGHGHREKSARGRRKRAASPLRSPQSGQSPSRIA